MASGRRGVDGRKEERNEKGALILLPPLLLLLLLLLLLRSSKKTKKAGSRKKERKVEPPLPKHNYNILQRCVPYPDLPNNHQPLKTICLCLYLYLYLCLCLCLCQSIIFYQASIPPNPFLIHFHFNPRNQKNHLITKPDLIYENINRKSFTIHILRFHQS